MSLLRQKLESSVVNYWYSPKPPSAKHLFCTALLSPFRAIYQSCTQHRVDERSKPVNATPTVIVIGNITVGGTGKTPLLIALADALRAKGLRVGVISRGYQSKLSSGVRAHFLTSTDDAFKVGDEAKLIFDALNHGKDTVDENFIPVVICQNRALALDDISHKEIDVVLSDDGLQHYRMPRHLEVVVVDGARGFGNGRLLPQGPLRESTSRLSKVDHIMVNGAASAALMEQLETFNVPIDTITPRLSTLTPLSTVAENLNDVSITSLLGNYQQVILVAGIGRPSKFFDSVVGESKQLSDKNGELAQLVEYPFPDHHDYKHSDFKQILRKYDDKTSAMLMTVKDAVKCTALVKDLPLPIFSVDLAVNLSSDFVDAIAEHCSLDC